MCYEDRTTPNASDMKIYRHENIPTRKIYRQEISDIVLTGRPDDACSLRGSVYSGVTAMPRMTPAKQSGTAHDIFAKP